MDPATIGHGTCNQGQTPNPEIDALQQQILDLQTKMAEQMRLMKEAQDQIRNQDNNDNDSDAGSSVAVPRTIHLDDLRTIRQLLRSEKDELESIDPYAGGKDYEAFIEAVHASACQNGWTEQDTLKVMTRKLRDRAKEEFYALRQTERPKTVDEMTIWLRRVFGTKVSQLEGKQELARCIKKPDESLGAYAQRLRKLASTAFPEDNANTAQITYRNKVLVEQFIQGIDIRLANKVIEKGDFFTIEDVLEVAEKYESTISRQLPKNLYEERYSSSVRYVEQNTGTIRKRFEPKNERYSYREQRFGMEPKKDNQEVKKEHFSYERPKNVQNPNNGNRRPNQGLRCFNCQQEGHKSIGCLAPKKGPKCFTCGKPGHYSQNCFLKSKTASKKPPK